MAADDARVRPQVGADAATDDVAERRRERRCVELSIAGDGVAFREIVDRHHRGLFALCLRMLGDRAEAEDLVQETFAKSFRSLEEYDPAYRLSTWLYRIALNTCRDHIKSPRRRERPRDAALFAEISSTNDDPRPDLDLERAERASRVRSAIDRLSDAYREAIVLKDLQDLSYQEIRDITGHPITALKIRVVRARARLRELLEEEP